MTESDLIPVFDGHNDTLLRLYQSNEADVEKLFIEGTPGGHIDMPRAKKGGFAGGMFAIFPPPNEKTKRSAGDVREAMANGSIAAVFHIEGVEAIDPELAMLDVLHAAGLRSLGIVWSRPNAFGNGVPFRFPSSPDTGPGLTDAGKALVKACNQLRIMIDLSHLNEKGFRDVAALSDAPLVATHSNVHAICGHSRNLTDWQLGAIRETGGMVGLNFATGFLREDGRMNADTSLDIMLRHIESLLQALGEDGVGLGSDFDGAMIPAVIGDVAGLPKLLDALAARGFGRALIEKIAYRNWLRVLERTIG
ncbi:MAG: membrane dipeptidase [Mesorhizobium sp.]|nr:MAG: membrane dipeptidase [Mesorhizobium sp.]